MQQSKKEAYTRRLLIARLRILNNYGFFGVLLMHMKFGIDEECNTAYTNGSCICFSPDFLEQLSDSELDFVLIHEIMHVALKHCFRGHHYNQYIFNIACDIVVNSNILKTFGMDLGAITLRCDGVAMHEIDGQEGYLFTAEEVYEKLIKDAKEMSLKSFDDHSHWDESDGLDKNDIDTMIISAVQSELNKMKNGKTAGNLPEGILRLVKELTDSTINWRALLNDFLSFDITDYTFLPPDRRYDGPFFLPSFSEPEEKIEEILYMVDTSGSMSEQEITDVYSEIKGAIEQYSGRFKAKIGFFDSAIYDPVDFESVEDLKKIIPRGGGGTSFRAVFDYVTSLEDRPKALLILTDGCDTFPPQELLLDIPILWLINNGDVTPPYGIVARIKY